MHYRGAHRPRPAKQASQTQREPESQKTETRNTHEPSTKQLLPHTHLLSARTQARVDESASGAHCLGCGRELGTEPGHQFNVRRRTPRAERVLAADPLPKTSTEAFCHVMGRRVQTVDKSGYEIANHVWTNCHQPLDVLIAMHAHARAETAMSIHSEAVKSRFKPRCASSAPFFSQAWEPTAAT